METTYTVIFAHKGEDALLSKGASNEEMVNPYYFLRLYCRYLNAELFSCADGSLLRDTKHCRAALQSHGTVLLFPPARHFFHH